MARFGVFRLILSAAVVEETENALLRLWAQAVGDASSPEGLRADARFGELIDEFALYLRLSDAERIAPATPAEIDEARPLIRHQHDVPVLAEAIRSRPDWLITSNEGHFDANVARQTGLRIVNQFDFLRLWSVVDAATERPANEAVDSLVPNGQLRNESGDADGL